MRIGGVRINVLLEEKSFIYGTLWILTLSLSSAYFLSLSCGFMILMAFFGAMIVLALIIETHSSRGKLPNLFHKWNPVRWHEGFSCQECRQLDCLDHINSSEPWEGIRVPSEIDAALEKTIERLLQTYVNDWYTALSLDDELTQNLRWIIRHLCANLARRCAMLDLASLITNEVTDCVLRHLVGVFRADEITKALPYGDVETMRKEFFDLPNIKIHEALKSREHESDYLLDLSSAIAPHILPPKEIKCQSMRYLIEDLLSGAVLQPIADITPNPDIINHLLILAFDTSHSKKLPEPSRVEVNLLEGLTRQSSLTSFSRKNLKMDLSAILKNQSALYSFINFLKEENAVNSIQFCFTVEDFNKRIGDPNLNPDELDVLHSEAVNLFDTYLKRSSPYRVSVSEELVEAIRGVLMKPVSDIVELRSFTPLFKAYEEVFNYLETVMCPLFHKSEEYFMFLLGKRTEESFEDIDKSGNRSHSSYNPKADGGDKTSRMTSSGSRSKMSDDGENPGSALDLTDIYDEDDHDVNGVRLSGVERRHEFRDLSAWRVSIPRLSTVTSPSKPYFVFIIEVQRIDVESRDGLGEDLHWSVKRRSSEFYALESKLTEFHGEFEDARLPPKSKLFTGKGLDSLQAKQLPFEEYLTKLLQKPSLKESDLLYTFLTSKEEFTLAASKLGLGKMIKNVKLTKEKGQSLQPFIDSFIASTRPGSPKPRADILLKELDVPEDRRSKLHPLFGDNAERTLDIEEKSPYSPKQAFDPSIMEDVEGLCDVFIYLSLRVFNLCKWKLQCLMAIRLLMKESLDHLVRYGIASRLRQLLSAPRIAYLITLIDDAIFGKASGQVRTERDKLDRQHLAQLKFQSYLSPYLSQFFGAASFQNGTQRIFMALQDPILNKQLFYQLLDVLVQRLIPEIQRPPK